MSSNEIEKIIPITQRAEQLCQRLLAKPTVEEIEEATSLLIDLRNLREFNLLCDLAELVCRFRLDDAKSRRLYAQGLIETHRLSAAIEFLNGAKQHFGEQHPESAEFDGLIGRAYKQLLIDTVSQDRASSKLFIELAIGAYQKPFDQNRTKHFWHGINIAALAQTAKNRGVSLSSDSPDKYADEVLSNLNNINELDRDQWWYATKAEAHIAKEEWQAAEQAIRSYLDHPDTTPFMLASTLRQFHQLWGIQDKDKGARLLQMLEATLMSRPTPGAVLHMESQHLIKMRELQPIDNAQLQRVIAYGGFETLEWYRTGLDRAAGVAAITERLGLRFGTGFAVQAKDFGVEPPSEILLLTNFHVLNSAGLDGQADFENVEVVFEAVSSQPLKLTIKSILAESDAVNGLDYALFRINESAEAIKPLRLTTKISAFDSKARVYVIGHPKGNVMQFSLQDNVLLDHECDPTGKPPNPLRRRVHYSASTEEGSSGSPVFNDKWDCIALHHAGGKRKDGSYGIQGLNGKIAYVEANEGIWIGSVQNDVKSKTISLTI